MGSRSERWDRDRFTYERDRDRDRVRYDDDDLAYPRESAPQFTRVRERSEVGDRFERRFMDRRAYDDDVVLRTRDYYYDDEPPRRQRSPPPVQVETDRRRVVIEKERIRSPSPPRRPGGMIRRQSSLDTFDRRPQRFYEREEYGPPARREDFRPPTNVPIPLPRSRALPPPRFVERDYYDDVRDIRVSEPDHFGDDDFRPMPERVREREREREVVRTRKRNHSRESRAMSHSTRSRSRSSSVSSRSSSSSGGTAIRSEYPKKGKTRIPARLVSERALVDMRYPFIKEGNTIIIQMALGQENIDDLLKISETYKKTEAEIAEERRRQEEIVIAPLPVVEVPPPPPAPVIVPVEPAPPPPPAVEVVNTTTVIRDTSPSRSSVSSGRTPIIVDTRPREYSEGVPVGPLALVSAEHHKHRHRSHSRGNHSIRAEIRDLERELARRERHVGERELVKAERLSNGELVLYEETVERIEPAKKGIRIEKDKKGRMSISVPKYR